MSYHHSWSQIMTHVGVTFESEEEQVVKKGRIIAFLWKHFQRKGMRVSDRENNRRTCSASFHLLPRLVLDSPALFCPFL